MWSRILILLLLTYRAHSVILFLTGALANTSFSCATVNKLIGPQAKVTTSPVVAELLVHRQADPCVIDNTDVSKKVVYLTVNGACADEKIYENFYARGAVAIVRSTDMVPGSDYNLGNEDARQHPNWNAVPFVELSIDYASTMIAGNGALVSLTPDPNLWQSTYSSLLYQVFLRWIPSLTAFITFSFAVSFLSQHLRILRKKYLITTPVGNESTSSWLLFLRMNANVSLIALTIEAISSVTLMLIWSVGGFWSTSNLPAPVVRFFATQLSGFAYITTMLSARFWHKMVAELTPAKRPSKPPSFLNRALRGKVLLVNVVSICGPLVLDLVLDVEYARYKDRQYPSLVTINALVFVSIDIVLAVYFLQGSIMLQMQMESLLRRLQGDGQSLRDFRFRTIRCASGLGICMLTCSTATLIAGLAPGFYVTPKGWTICWSMFTNARILQSLFHVIMFRPATKSEVPSRMTPNNRSKDWKSSYVPDQP